MVIGREEIAADGSIYDMDYAHSNLEFGYASADRCAYIRRFNIDLSKAELRAVLQGHESDVTCIRWNKVNENWVTGSDDCSVRIWSKEGIPCIKIIENQGPVSCLAIDTSNGCIVTGSLDRVIRVFDSKRKDELVQRHSGHTDAVRGIVVLPSRRQYVSVSWDQTIRVWNAFVRKGQSFVSANERVSEEKISFATQADQTAERISSGVKETNESSQNQDDDEDRRKLEDELQNTLNSLKLTV
jgi:WD40 repeat protein